MSSIGISLVLIWVVFAILFFSARGVLHNFYDAHEKVSWSEAYFFHSYCKLVNYVSEDNAEEGLAGIVMADSAYKNLDTALRLIDGILEKESIQPVYEQLRRFDLYRQHFLEISEKIKVQRGRFQEVEQIAKEVRALIRVNSFEPLELGHAISYVENTRAFLGTRQANDASMAAANLRSLLAIYGRDLAPQLRRHLASLEAAEAGKREIESLYETLKEETEWLSRNADEVADQFHNFKGTIAQSVFGSMLLGILAVTIALILPPVIISTRIARNLRMGISHLNRCAMGDYSVDVQGKVLTYCDEIGDLARAVKNVIDGTRGALSNVMAGTSHIAQASDQLNRVSQQISQGTNTQAAGVEEVSSAIEQMMAEIDHSNDNAQETGTIANGMKTKISEVASKAGKAVEMVRTISEKISIIGEIVEQTNILALNAAVEAARAGEHGRGFSVVAAEVRKLAERSKEAADQILALSHETYRTSEEAGKALESVMPDVVRTVSLVQDIAAASNEQRSGVEQINNAIQQLNGIIQENAAAAEEMATSAEELNAQADTLSDAVGVFHL